MTTTVNSLTAETLQHIFILASQEIVTKKPQVHTMTLYCVCHHWKIVVLTCPTLWKALNIKIRSFNRALKFYPNYTNTLTVLTLENDEDISPTIDVSNILFKNIISLEFKKLSQDWIVG